ncbi:MAG: flotillin family protein [Chloroflexia bacterium]|nr:flotillin family protein [Chloroflexia bacterium]
MEWFFIIVGVAVIVVIFVAYWASRYRKVGPNQALIISGTDHRFIDPVSGDRSRRGFRIIKGGGTFVWPVVERVDALSLELLTLDVLVNRGYTKEGVPVTVECVAQIKVRGDEVSIATAAEQFLSKKTNEMANIALQTLEGHLRAILGTLSPEQINSDRDAFAQEVQEVSAADLAKMGLEVVSFTVKEIRDEEGYLDALGVKPTAERKRDAAIGEALAQRDAAIEAAKAKQAAREAELEAETRIKEAEKLFKVQTASFDREADRERAEADLAYALQQNTSQQQVTEQEVQVQVVQKRKEIEVQEQEALRKEKELLATVVRPAEAEQQRIRTLAEATKFQRQIQAEGEAEAIRSVGQAEADAAQARGTAQADVTKLQGLAQADVIRAQGLAEAEAMEKKAAAWAEYNQAAIIQQIIDALPQVATAVASPLSKTERIVVISQGGDGAGAGSSRITQDISNIIAQVPATVEALTGVDLIQAIRNLPGLKGAAEETEAEPEGQSA